MIDLEALASKVAQLAREAAKRHYNASLFVKLALVAGGAMMAAIAQGVEIAHANHEISAWTIAGFASSAIVGLGGIFVAMTETDATHAIETARDAVDQARAAQREQEKGEAIIAFLGGEVQRGLELYNSMDVMRGGIEQSLGLPGMSAAKVIQTCLSAAVNSLVIAFAFEISDTWTICVYAATQAPESDKISLKCVAHERKIPCDVREAREWPEGVGVAGVAYSMRNEVIIPDMLAPDLGTVFRLHSSSRDYDGERYRSMVCVPIMVGDAQKPWGVAVVTTARADHFTTEAADGVSTTEPIRAIAAMAALAVKALQAVETTRIDTPEDASTSARKHDEAEPQKVETRGNPQNSMKL